MSAFAGWRFGLLALAIMTILSPSAFAANCSTPTGVEGAVIYNDTHKVVQYCNGTAWYSLGGGGVSDGDKTDITVTGSGATWTIDPQAVTYAKIQNATSGAILGRYAAGAGVIQELTFGSGISLNTSTGIITATGLGVTDGDKGDVTVSSSGGSWNVDSAAITYAKIQNVTSGKLLGRYTAGAGVTQEITVGTGLSLNTTTGELSSTASASAGTDTQVIFNDTGALAGVADMIFAKTPKRLTVVGFVKSGQIELTPVNGAAPVSFGSGGTGNSADFISLALGVAAGSGAQILSNSFVDSYLNTTYVDIAQPPVNLNSSVSGLLQPSVVGGLDSYTKLLMHFDGANGSATFVDETGKTMAAISGATLATAQSKFGGASGVFSGGQYVTVNSSADFNFGTNDFTVDWWEYRTAGGSRCAMASDRTATYAMLLGYDVSGTIYAFMSSNGSAWDIASAVSMGAATYNTWNHMAVVRTGSTFYAFKNGTQTSTWSSSAAIWTPGGPWTFGTCQTSQYFSGFIDEARVTKGLARWTSGFTPPSVAYYAATGNMATRSATIAAGSIPTTMKVIAKVNYIDTPTLGTDLMFDVSRDNGTTWVAASTYNVTATAGSVRTIETDNITAGGTGSTNLRYRIRTANNKMVEIQDVYLSWQ